MRWYKKDAHPFTFTTASTKTAVLAVLALVLSAILILLANLLLPSSDSISIILSLSTWLLTVGIGLLVAFAILLLAMLVLIVRTSAATEIYYMVRRSLFCSEYGNPLRLKDGERLPKLRCKALPQGAFEISLSAVSVTTQDIEDIATSISSALRKKYSRYAVTRAVTDDAYNTVTFTIEDVTIDKSLVVNDVKELTPAERTKFIIQQGAFIDLTTSGSMLVAGKTRSGKTTGIISILLQALLAGRDAFGSLITIIDPKQAELSRLPHVVTLDENGEATAILDAIRAFVNCIVKRQKNLNDLSEQSGDAVKWDAAGMQPSFLFIDEYVSVRTMFPTKADKERPDYSLATFDALIKRIVTMGASAGCFVIISIAEASVAEGGLPAMLRSAMSTKILFKPTLTEGRLLWDSDKLETLNTGRTYNAGDAWFSSTDGIHDNVSYVHFPRMEFPVYRELGALLERYYQ